MNIPRETFEKFKIYERLVKEWNGKTRLVQENTLLDFQRRHIADSLQILDLIDDAAKHIIDIGSGAGLPGLVLAISGCPNVTLCESNEKKCFFLDLVSRETGTEVTIKNDRVEALQETFDVLVSRAMASLSDLLRLSFYVSRETSEAILLKGRNCKKELDDALKKYSFDYEILPSQTSPEGSILRIRKLEAL